MSKLGNNLPVKKSPALDIPQQLRDQNLAFKYSPLFQASWGDYSILIGDWMCAITNSIPYQGWKSFKKAILEIVSHLQACGLIKKIERYSLKYVDLIEAATTKQQLALIELDLKLGNYDIKDNPINLRVELSKDSFFHVVEIISNTVIADENKPKNGILINIDSIKNNPPENFWESLSDNLELIHTANKELFFNFLKEETLISLEPSYDH